MVTLEKGVEGRWLGNAEKRGVEEGLDGGGRDVFLELVKLEELDNLPTLEKGIERGR